MSIKNRLKRVFRKDVIPDNLEDEGGFVIASVLTDIVEKRFAPRVGRSPRFVCRPECYTKYRKTFNAIYDYLEELSRGFGNSIESLAEGYLESIYERYGYFKKTPFLTQLGPTEKNCLGFECWIHQWEEHYEESYWVTSESIDLEKIKEKVAEHAYHKGADFLRKLGELDICEV